MTEDAHDYSTCSSTCIRGSPTLSVHIPLAKMQEALTLHVHIASTLLILYSQDDSSITIIMAILLVTCTEAHMHTFTLCAPLAGSFVCSLPGHAFERAALFDRLRRFRIDCCARGPYH